MEQFLTDRDMKFIKTEIIPLDEYFDYQMLHSVLERFTGLEFSHDLAYENIEFEEITKIKNKHEKLRYSFGGGIEDN